MSRDSESKFQVHLSSTKAMFQYMTPILNLSDIKTILVHQTTSSWNFLQNSIDLEVYLTRYRASTTNIGK